jgi:hypothetical protein
LIGTVFSISLFAIAFTGMYNKKDSVMSGQRGDGSTEIVWTQ